MPKGRTELVEKVQHERTLKAADATLEAHERVSKETRERLKRALAAYEERRRA